MSLTRVLSIFLSSVNCYIYQHTLLVILWQPITAKGIYSRSTLTPPPPRRSKLCFSETAIEFELMYDELRKWIYQKEEVWTFTVYVCKACMRYILLSRKALTTEHWNTLDQYESNNTTFQQMCCWIHILIQSVS